MNHDSNNIMVILSSPSGAGKTTITKKIQQNLSNSPELHSPQNAPNMKNTNSTISINPELPNPPEFVMRRTKK